MRNQVAGKLLRKVAFAAQDALQPIDNTFLILHGIKNAVDMRPVFNVAVRVIFRRIQQQYFDIVVFPFKENTSKLLIKRIIGMPGETVQIKNGKVYINGYDTGTPALWKYL